MRIYELFEAPFNIPGVLYTVNDPMLKQGQGQQPQGPPQALNAVGSTAQSNVAPNTSNVAPGTQPPASGQLTLPADINQKLTKGSTISLPIGPGTNPQKTPMKVTNTDMNSLGAKGRTVTVQNPRTPNQPAQTFDYDQLAQVVADQNKQP